MICNVGALDFHNTIVDRICSAELWYSKTSYSPTSVTLTLAHLAPTMSEFMTNLTQVKAALQEHTRKSVGMLAGHDLFMALFTHYAQEYTVIAHQLTY